jgi:hypothetical protein
VADVVQITNVRVLKALERRGVVRVSPESLEVDDVLSARDPALAQLAAAAVASLAVPSGPRACHTCPRPTRLRRARRPQAQPSASASPCSFPQVVRYKMSLHQMVRASAPDLRFDRGQVPRVPGGFPPQICCRGAWTHEAACTRPRP